MFGLMPSNGFQMSIGLIILLFNMHYQRVKGILVAQLLTQVLDNGSRRNKQMSAFLFVELCRTITRVKGVNSYIGGSAKSCCGIYSNLEVITLYTVVQNVF